ncbi:MAG: hypothetical protein ACO1TE_09045 [Prosthecobacter sp.]
MSLQQKIQRWVAQASGVLLTQAGVQVIGAVTGFILVRWMPKHEYAWLTICGSLLATIGLLADGGISTAITAMSGRVAGDKAVLAQVVDACLRVRNRLAWLSLALTLPPFYLLLTRSEMDAWMAAMIAVTAGICLWPVTSSKFLPVPLRVAGHLKATQTMELTGVLVRCALTGLVLAVGWNNVYPAFLATVASVWLHAHLARNGLRQVLGAGQAEPVQVLQAWGFVRALYANHIFYCVQGQVATWIITVTAGVTQIADVGALARLTVIFSILGATFHYLILPSVASTRCPVQVRTKLIVSLVITVAVVMTVVVAAWFVPWPFLWVLGDGYAHLSIELPLAFTAQGLGMINGVVWTFMQVRGWVRLSWLNIPLSILGYILGVILVDLSTVVGVLLMSAVAVTPPLLWALIYTGLNLRREIALKKGQPFTV